ncbi:MAG: hypothetical protein IPM95_14255 [Sphingobacteriales bacterium]|nr:hypothetical protein [Sphingobacteriales bacterium]
MKSIISLVLFLTITLSLVAQAPQGINYQTVVRNTSGTVLANTNVGIKINIRSTSATGTIVYAETHAVSTNQFGLVNFVIGQGTVVTGTFANINWGNGSYFAETLVDPAGGTAYVSVGAQQLMSVPYALYASKASNGSSWKDTIFNFGNSNMNLVFNRTNALISPPPYNKFGTGIGYGTLELSAPYPYLDFTDTLFTRKDADMRLAYDKSFGGYLTISTYDSTVLNKWKWDQFTFNKNGRMGIGTNQPHVKLDVKGDVRSSNSDTTNFTYIGGTDGALILRRKNDLAHIDFISTSDTSVRITCQNNGLVFNTGQTLTSYNERLRILSNGNIGIGNSNPKSKLTVTGGDVNITDIASGIILKSPNGNCWRVTIDNSGNLVRTAITCP